MIEHQGIAVKIDRDKNFGFVYSEIDNKNYYFRISSYCNKINYADKVAFIIVNKDHGEWATAVRKIYENSLGQKFIPRINSNHIHLDLDLYLSKIIDRIGELNGEFFTKEFEFPEIIGKTIYVQTDDDDQIVYAIRNGKSGHTRFVLNREPIDCRHITVVLKKTETHFVIISIFIGQAAPYEPYDLRSTPNDLEFWNNHALIYGTEDILAGSETTNCPWVLNKHNISKLENQNQLIKLLTN